MPEDKTIPDHDGSLGFSSFECGACGYVLCSNEMDASVTVCRRCGRLVDWTGFLRRHCGVAPRTRSELLMETK